MEMFLIQWFAGFLYGDIRGPSQICRFMTFGQGYTLYRME